MTQRSGGWTDSAALYDTMAAHYDSIFAAPGYRRAYDRLAGEYTASLLPKAPGIVVDAGCGTGRWAARWLGLGHRVIGIEQSPQMVARLHERDLGGRFHLIEQSMDEAEVESGSADLVVAMGSMQYVADPEAMLRRFTRWVKPSGHVCIYTDSLAALVLELMRIGKTEEALLRLKTRRGLFREGDTLAELHLFDRAALEALFVSAGLVEVRCHGLLVTASAWGKAHSTNAAQADEEGFLALERRLMADPAMADAGKHIIASGRRPAVG
jgi:SAM-dependent methyltransferase